MCEQEYLSLFPALAISYYANLKGLKVELGSDRLFGIPLDVYIPLEQVAIQVNTDSEKIDILKEHLCKQRGIKLIKLPMKPNEVEPEYAQRIKAAFQSVHIFISSDTEEDVKIIRKIFKNWRNSREKKYHIYLTDDEQSRVIQSLINLKNNLIVQGRYTDAVDEVLLKVLSAKKKKLKIK